MNDFNDWISRKRTATDIVSARLVREFRTTLDKTLCSYPLLPGIHWCLSPDMLTSADLGRDGHPRTGLLLPDLGLPRRMWAAGRLSYLGNLAEGDQVERVTVIRDVSYKTGRTGKLGFVTIDHNYSVAGEVRIEEEQNIVYRENPDPGTAPPAHEPAEAWKPIRTIEITPDPTMLFRYSAITFNGHRIHYDHPYATGTEGYRGLVVHGPMQSTWLQHMATEILGRLPHDFQYRGVAPLICGRPAAIEARPVGDLLELRVRDLEANTATMLAWAR